MKYDIRYDDNNNNNKYVAVTKTGYDLINNPMYNKSSGFTEDERSELKLHGLIPCNYFTIEQRRCKIYNVFKSKATDIEKHIFIRGVQDRNETMFYSLISEHIEEILPIIYTPTVGEACQKFSEIYRKPRGLFISYPNIDQIEDILANSDFDGTEVIVVTDGERILGLGDQGCGGMGIPIGKLSLYTAIAGIAPYKTLPIILDVGTDNTELLNDPQYIGWANKRIRGNEYDNFMDKFIQAIKKRFPNVLLQFEDFAQQNALKLLNKYKDELCCFNDDIQGTASVVVGALLSAINASGVALHKQKMVICGAGSAGVGIANLIVDCLVENGIERNVAISQLFLVDRFGLITDKVESLDFQKPFLKSVPNWNVSNPQNISLLETVTNAKATMLLGVSAQAGIFTQDIITQMTKNTNRPIVFPISNPTSKAEATPSDVLKWSNNTALVGTGSPFPDVEINGKLKRIDQVNNAYIFPALGLAILALKAKQVTPRMFLIAAIALSEMSPTKDDNNANLLPELCDIHKVAKHIAYAIATEVVNAGLSTFGLISADKIKQLVDDFYWVPEYLPYKLATVQS